MVLAAMAAKAKKISGAKPTENVIKSETINAKGGKSEIGKSDVGNLSIQKPKSASSEQNKGVCSTSVKLTNQPDHPRCSITGMPAGLNNNCSVESPQYRALQQNNRDDTPEYQFGHVETNVQLTKIPRNKSSELTATATSIHESLTRHTDLTVKGSDSGSTTSSVQVTTTFEKASGECSGDVKIREKSSITLDFYKEELDVCKNRIMERVKEKFPHNFHVRKAFENHNLYQNILKISKKLLKKIAKNGLF